MQSYLSKKKYWENMMDKGNIFDIKEFSIHDGPGIRVTVFLKGCPLRCKWCHNPEGIDTAPVYNVQTNKYVGSKWDVKELVEYLMGYRQFFADFGGGVTFSGGEPTAQAEFLYECAIRMPQLHKLLDTCGYCDTKSFELLSEHFELFYFDLKLIDEQEHITYTGVSNKRIHENLALLMDKNKKTVIRMPMIPGITDTMHNLEQAVQLISKLCPDRQAEIHLLPYNELAGGKYPVYGMEYPLKGSYRKNNIAVIRNFEKVMRSKNYKLINYVEGESI